MGNNEHTRRVNKILEDLVQNHGSEDESGLFVRVEQIISDPNSNEHQSKYIVELSVLTKEIYDYDKETIIRYEPKDHPENPDETERHNGEEYEIKDTDKSISIENYRPFLVFLTIRISEQELNKFEALKNKWIKAEFHEKKQTGDYSANLLCNVFPFQIYKKKIKISEYIGPYFFYGKDINTLTKADYDINKFNSCLALEKDVETELNNAWSNLGYEYIDIYNIGHGNADYIVCHDEKRILYDIGVPYPGYSLLWFPEAAKAFGKLKPSLVIISHWDADHYMGSFYINNNDVLNVKWIAPFQFTEGPDKPISINLFRLVAYLRATDKLMLVDIKNAGKLVASSGTKDNAIKLLMGSCTDKETKNISKKNREGLYIELGEKDDKISVLAGDVSYNSMDNSIFSKQLTFLHVPHHGSKMKLSRLLNSQWGKHAVISTKYKLGSTEVNFSHERVLNTTFNGNVHNTSEYYGDLRSIRLLKSGEVQKIISDNYIII